MADTTAAAHMPATICAKKHRPARTGLIAPMSKRPSVTWVLVSAAEFNIWESICRLTAGLNSPPLTLKKTQTLTANEKPKARLMYKRVFALGACDNECPDVAVPSLSAAAFATCVAAKARNRNMKVPQNSAIVAMSRFLHRFGMKLRRSSRCLCG